jgi:hypothetical protein
MKKLVALLLAVPRFAGADESIHFEAAALVPSAELVEAGAPPATAAPSVAELDVAPASAVTHPDDSATEAQADPAALTYGAELDVASRYVWRGLAFSEHPVVQPSARLSKYAATLGIASSAYLGAEPGVQDTVSELDFTGRYDLTLGAASISPTLGVYLYPHAPSTAELGGTIGYDLSLITLVTHQALDIADNVGGYYADVGAANSQRLGAHMQLDTAASFGWCSGSFGRYYIDDTLKAMHWGAAQLDSSLTLTATDALYFRLHGTVSRMLEERIRHLAPDENLISGGLALGMTN